MLKASASSHIHLNKVVLRAGYNILSSWQHLGITLKNNRDFVLAGFDEFLDIWRTLYLLPNPGSSFHPPCKRIYSIRRLVRLSLLQLRSIELLHLKDFGLSSTLGLQGYAEWRSVFGIFKSNSENYKAHYKCLSNKATVLHAGPESVMAILRATERRLNHLGWIRTRSGGYGHLGIRKKKTNISVDANFE